MPRLRRWLRRLFTYLKIACLCLVMVLIFQRGSEEDGSLQGRVYNAVRGHAFNFIEWELGALGVKARQELFGFHAYLPESERNQYVLDYFALQNRAFILEGQIEAASRDNPAALPDLNADYAAVREEMRERQPLAEHIIEGQVSAVLQAEGIDILGQVWPPVTMHFLQIPDVLVVSPRDEIRQAMTVVLNPMSFDELVTLEAHVAAQLPEMSVWITRIGGVGIWPSMVRETDRAVIAFEIVAHEWAHHYLIFYPLGLEYLSRDETRIINETTATVVGDEIGNRVIERFYQDELAAGQVYLQPIPDYRVLLAEVQGGITLEINTAIEGWNRAVLLTRETDSRLQADYLLSVGNPEAAQILLERRANQAALLGQAPPTYPNAARAYPDNNGWIHHTRTTVDYLLALGNVPAAEAVMENGRQHTGLRVLNQAWFAFNVGYQANPTVQRQADGRAAIVTSGGGGDPIGAAIYEIRARAGSLRAFLEIMRGITTRAELLAELARLRLENP